MGEGGGIHSCDYYCERPACIKAQRDELRAKFEALNAPGFATLPEPGVVSDEDEVVCLECGQPTMHMGQICYACSHPSPEQE